MKVKDLDLDGWQKYLDAYKSEVGNDKSTPIAMRIEGTQLTVGRYSGGMTYNGEKYTYFEPRITGHEPNPDGTPYVAWLMVRMDFLMWLTERLRKENKEEKKGKKARRSREPDLLEGAF